MVLKHDDNIVDIKTVHTVSRVAGNINTPSHERVSLGKSEGGEVSGADCERCRARTFIAGGSSSGGISIISPSFGRWGDLP